MREKCESGEKGPLPSLPNPLPFSLPPYPLPPFQRLRRVHPIFGTPYMLGLPIFSSLTMYEIHLKLNKNKTLQLSNLQFSLRVCY